MILLKEACRRDRRACHAAGIDAYFPIVRGVCTLDEALDADNAFSNLANAAEEVFRVMQVARG